MNGSGKHQPCGKAGCINCWPESKGFNGQAPMLNEDEFLLRESIIRQIRGQQNIAPGSPLYDRVMGTNLYSDHVDYCKKRHLDPETGEAFEAAEHRRAIAGSQSANKFAMKTSTQIKLAFCMMGFAIGVFCVLGTLAVQS